MDLKNKNVVIASLARDCKKELENNIKRIEKLRTYFNKSYVIIVENDSIDGTKDLLNKWATKEDIILISQDFNTETTPQKMSNIVPGMSIHRIQKMAYFRNLYMRELNKINDRIDYLIVIDIDIDNFVPNDIIQAILSAPDDWGGLFSNGSANVTIKGIHIGKCYYDSYAFVSRSDEPYKLEADFVLKRRKFVLRNLLFKKYLKCKSAFSGIGIYKFNLIKDNQYSLVPNIETESKLQCICEHIPFNMHIINQGYSNYIVRNLKVKYKERISFTYFMAVFSPSCFLKLYHKLF